jgi:hypothetical protein
MAMEWKSLIKNTNQNYRIEDTVDLYENLLQNCIYVQHLSNNRCDNGFHCYGYRDGICDLININLSTHPYHLVNSEGVCLSFNG